MRISAAMAITAMTQPDTSSRSMPVTSNRITQDGTRHAVPAAAALAELEARDLDHLHPGLAHLRDRERVAFVGDHHAGLQRYHVVAVVPRLPLLLVGVAAGGNHLQLWRA